MASGSLPLVPVSPLVKTSIVCKNAYAQATEKLSHVKQATNPRVEVNLLRRLIEDTKVERHRLDTVEKQMEAVEAATPFNWEPDVLARQVAAVDCQLFEKVIFKKKWLCNMDKKHTNLVHLVDFHRYLTNSFAHQLIYWSELKASSPVVPSVHPKDNLVTHLVRTAYLLVHVYRDFSGFAAVMKALMLPEVRRLRKLWHTCPSRTRDLYRDLAQIVSPFKNYQAYHELLGRKLETFYSQSNRTSKMIAIPWIQPHLQDIRSIVKEYTAGNEASGLAVLSAPGARKLSQVVSVLELCKQSSTSEVLPDELLLDDEQHKRKSRRMSVKPIQFDGVRTVIQPPSDLTQLVPGDLQLYHWLVSRVFLTKDQLIEESIQVEHLAPGEELVCDKEDEDDEIDVEPPSLSIPPTPVATDFQPQTFNGPEMHSVPVTTERSAGQSDHDNDDNDDDSDDDSDDDGNGFGDVAVVTDEPPAATTPELLEPETTTTEAKHAEGKPATAEEHDLQNEWADRKSNVVGKSQAAQSETTSLSQQDSSSSKQTKRSRLSPSAPEFVPSTKLSLAVLSDKGSPRSPTASSSVVVSPASSTRDTQSLIIPQEQPTVAEQEATDDPEEEWHGYMYHQDKKTDNEPKKCDGYPSPPLESNTPGRRGSSSQSEDSEVWKGYHASKMEDDWQQEINRKVQNCEWQGYTLETLDEDELDSSTMINGEFEKSRQARRKDDPVDALHRIQL